MSKKSLKQHGVPFVARMLFRVQHTGTILAIVGMALTLPALFLWAVIHPSGIDFIDGVEDVIEQRTDELTIDRIDSNGNYEPSNCRWVTQKIQCNNKGTNVFVEVDGKRQTIKQWADETGMHMTTLYERYRRGARGYDVIKPSTEMLRASILPHQVRGKRTKPAVARTKTSHVSHANI